MFGYISHHIPFYTYKVVCLFIPKCCTNPYHIFDHIPHYIPSRPHCIIFHTKDSPIFSDEPVWSMKDTPCIPLLITYYGDYTIFFTWLYDIICNTLAILITHEMGFPFHRPVQYSSVNQPLAAINQPLSLPTFTPSWPTSRMESNGTTEGFKHKCQSWMNKPPGCLMSGVISVAIYHYLGEPPQLINPGIRSLQRGRAVAHCWAAAAQDLGATWPRQCDGAKVGRSLSFISCSHGRKGSKDMKSVDLCGICETKH